MKQLRFCLVAIIFVLNVQLASSTPSMMVPYYEDGKVVFSLKDDAHIKQVALAGIFNSWNGDRDYFNLENDGVWRARVELLPGRHAYKFVVNDSDWIPDPNHQSITEDMQNNSCFTLTDSHQIVMYDPVTSSQGEKNKTDAFPLPDWSNDAVLYHIDAGVFSKKGFQGVVDKLDYLESLGVNTLLLMPVFEVGERNQPGTRGDIYAVKNFYQISSRLGGEKDLKTLVSKAKSKGFRFMLDIPVNRSSIDNALINKHSDWFQQDSAGNVIYEIPGRSFFAGFHLNNTDARQYIIAVFRHWLKELDLDGFRVDDADMMDDLFMSSLANELIKIKPDVLLLSHSVNEFHSRLGPYITSDGSVRLALNEFSKGDEKKTSFIEKQNLLMRHFPKSAKRLIWLEEKEQNRWHTSVPPNYWSAGVALSLFMPGIPVLMMGQEFGDTRWNGIESSYSEIFLDWNHSNKELFALYRELLQLRRDSKLLREGKPILDLLDDKVILLSKQYEGDVSHIVINVSGDPQKIGLEIFEKNRMNFIYSSEKVSRNYYKEDQFIVMPYEVVILDSSVK